MKMSRKRKISDVFGLGIPQIEHATDHPFIRWYAGYFSQDAAHSVGRDLFMGPLASRRFSIDTEDDGTPVLGVAEDDVESFMALRWSAAAFLKRVEKRDWVALSCRDARVERAVAKEAVALRLWLPATLGILDGWNREDPDRPKSLKIIETYIRGGKPIEKGSSSLTILPLEMKGSWEFPAK